LNAQNLPLVLVHGFMGGSAQWELQEPLAQDRRIIPIDLPGFGSNAHLDPVNTIDGFARWVLNALTDQDIPRFHLLGHSMGGMIVQAMVRLAPERIEKLVLYATGSIGLLPGRFEPIETSMARARSDGAEATARRISATWFLSQEAADTYRACAQIAVKSKLPAIIAGLEAMRDWSGVDHLPDIKAPTLIIWGDRDRTYAWPQIERLWTTIQDSHLAVLPGCAHAVHMESPALFNAIVSNHLARV
jgi:pimeloyl-ACP methyl ester carboxylesterase